MAGMTDDKTMTVEEADKALAEGAHFIREIGALFPQARVPEVAAFVDEARTTLSATLQARDAEVAKEREYAADAAARVLKAELAQRKAEAECARLRVGIERSTEMESMSMFRTQGDMIEALLDDRERLRALLSAEFTPHVEPVGINAGGDAEGGGACWCLTCRPQTLSDMRFVVCPDCGNKRCPHANDHRNACTNSNAPGQPGSAYPPNEAGHEEREDG